MAGYISRIMDHDNWSLDPVMFKVSDDWWGLHTVDSFATHYNAQLECFNSRYACPGSEAVDSFTADWGGENNWWYPPPCLVARVIGYAEVCKAQGTLIVPAWQSAHYWPVLYMPRWSFYCIICGRYGIITPVH